MKFSTMTEKELSEAYKHLAPALDLGLAEAGKCRHELDWLYGINLSRLLTESVVKNRAGYATLSTGRVQGPTLKFVVEREDEIGGHVPIPFWTIDASIKHDGKPYSLEYEKEKVQTLAEAERIVHDCTGSMLGVTEIESNETQQNPPFPFDLSTLQSEAYRHFGYTPSRTLSIAEHLYLDALISYPRTSSQKLPPDIGYETILQGLSRRNDYRWLVSKLIKGSLRPNQGWKDDPAHPAIYPTGELPNKALGYQEEKVFDLISRRFMATVAKPSTRLSSRMILQTGPYRFFLHGSRIVEPGWTEYYRPYVKDEDQEIPSLEKGGKVPMDSIRSLEKFTQPVPRYNPGSLLRKMEDENLGTKATRADIIEILYRRGYVKDQRMQATPLAVKVIGLLDKYCRLITDSGFTSHLEEMMDEIQVGKTTRRLVLLEALEHLRPVMLDLVQREEELGQSLGDTVTAQRVMEVTFETPCPECGSKLKIVRSRKTGKRFIGHAGPWDGTKKCNFSAPLPQFGTISILARRCPTCTFQMVQARSPGRRPLVSCPRCYAEKIRSANGPDIKSGVPRIVRRRKSRATSLPASPQMA
jgi:DNA topoisomerase I